MVWGRGAAAVMGPMGSTKTRTGVTATATASARAPAATTTAATAAAIAKCSLDKYAVLELVGEGSFGKVYRGRIKVSNPLSQKVSCINVRNQCSNYKIEW